jgi:hypothetical protein
VARSRDTTNKFRTSVFCNIYDIYWIYSSNVSCKNAELHYISVSNLMSTTQYVLRWVALSRDLSSSETQAAWYLLSVA